MSKVEAAISALRKAGGYMDHEELRELADKIEEEAEAFRMMADDVEVQAEENKDE